MPVEVQTTCPFLLRSRKCVLLVGVLILILLLFAIGAFHLFRPKPGEVVLTSLGRIVGSIGWSRNGKQFTEYLGIPYAQAPVGDKRFEPPVDALPWDGVRESKRMPICLQLEHFATGFIFGSEDCLFLNIFVPSGGRGFKPVMVYFHGGIFHVGGSDFAGPKYFMDEDVILITVNYRLGALGFFSTGDEVISGNAGLKDQNLALKWIQKNVAKFKGDPNRVTIFGESAGGASVHHHLLSPASRGLFQKAIHQSGSSINYWAVYRNVKEQAQKFAKDFGCPTLSSLEIVKCLKKLDGIELVTAHRELMDFYRPQISTFVPTIEPRTEKSAFLTEEPLKLLMTGDFYRVPVMTGVNSQEGQLISKTIMANQTKLNEANDNWFQWAPLTLHYPEHLRNVSKKLREFYFGAGVKSINSSDFHQSFTDMFGDRLFIVMGAEAAHLQSKFTRTHLYYYDYSGSFNAGELLASADSKLPSWLSIGFYLAKLRILEIFDLLPKRTENACHSDEIAMLFNRDLISSISSKHPDYEMSRDLVKLWTSFATENGPTLRFRNIEWKPMSNSGDVEYLKISDNPALIPEPFKERRLFWKSLNLPDL